MYGLWGHPTKRKVRAVKQTRTGWPGGRDKDGSRSDGLGDEGGCCEREWNKRVDVRHFRRRCEFARKAVGRAFIRLRCFISKLHSFTAHSLTFDLLPDPWLIIKSPSSLQTHRATDQLHPA